MKKKNTKTILYKLIARIDGHVRKKTKLGSQLDFKKTKTWPVNITEFEFKEEHEGQIDSLTHEVGMNQYDIDHIESNHFMVAGGVSACIAVAIIVSYDDGSKARYLGHINATKEWVDAGEIGEVEYYPKPSETVAELLDKKVTDYRCLITGGTDSKELLIEVTKDVVSIFRSKNIYLTKEKTNLLYQPFKLFPEKGEDEQYVSVGITENQILILN